MKILNKEQMSEASYFVVIIGYFLVLNYFVFSKNMMELMFIPLTLSVINLILFLVRKNSAMLTMISAVNFYFVLKLSIMFFLKTI
jgi:hypothetical protein